MMRACGGFLLGWAGLLLGAGCMPAPASSAPAVEGCRVQAVEFGRPERVAIEGYDGEAMEPFLSRDGRLLFFNNRNDPKVNTDLHWAERLDDLHFRYRGPVRGANTAALEGVASMDREGIFYFVSNRSYDKTASTLYRGRFVDGEVRDVELVPGVSLAKPGVVNIDAEISADGRTLYFVESQFSLFRRMKTARILVARRNGRGFVRDGAGAAMLKTVDTDAWNYAPATTEAECELFFTRVDRNGPAIYRASRADRTQAFGEPSRITAIDGFVEGPTVSPDGRGLYFHKKENDRFAIYRVAMDRRAAAH